MSDIERNLKLIIGDLVFQIAQLETKIEELTKEKEIKIEKVNEVNPPYADPIITNSK